MYDPRSRIAFRSWLTDISGIFWIAGKPGSGKSTMIRYLSDCSDTKSHLRLWASGSRLVTASFYFWTTGTKLQRSQAGLLRQLLFEIFRAPPDLIHQICPDRCNGRQTHSHEEWTLSSLRQALGRLGEQSRRTKFCFFIDGLDEYDGDQLDLIHTVSDLSKIPGIKICVSSRRWPVFEDAFGMKDSRKLYLEDLTREDIRLLARERLEESAYFSRLRSHWSIYMDLVEEITRKAEGVFLWVFLVARSLRDGLSNGDNAEMLKKRLRL